MDRSFLKAHERAFLSLLLCTSAFLGITGCGTRTQDRFNVVLVSLDTVRFDAPGYAGNKIAETPTMDALSKTGCSFAQAISTNSLTTPAHCSLFTGRYPTAHGVHNIGIYSLPQSEETLAEALKKGGYSTAAFAGAFPVSGRFGLSQGFDLYDEKFAKADQKQEISSHTGDFFAERPASTVADAAIAWVNQNLPHEQPFFLFVHFFDAHVPYNPPQEFVQRFGTSAKQRYAGEIAYIDSQLKRIVSALEKKKVSEKTIFILVGDHGESLGEHKEETHGLFIYDSTIRIPLLFSGGPVIRGGTFHDQVGIIDIFPTVLDLLGFPIPKNVHGRSLKALLLGSTDHLEERPYYIESFLSYESFGWAPLIGLRTPSAKLIRAPHPELYAFANDPFEEKNIYQSNPQGAKGLDRDLAGMIKTITKEPSQESAAKLSGQEIEILRSLGYIGAGVVHAGSINLADPKDRIDLYNQMKAAQTKVERGQETEKILEDLQAMVKEDPGNMTLKLIIGNALKSLDRTRDAEAHYRSLIAEFPQLTMAFNELAALLLKRQAWQDAAHSYQRSLEIDPAQIELYPNFIYALFKTGRIKDAVSSIEGALKRYPNEISLHSVRAELAYQVKDYSTAAKHFSIVFGTDPGDIKAAMNYARVLIPTNDAEQGIKILKPFADSEGNNTDFLLIYGQCLAQAGKLPEAMQYFEKVLSIEERPSAHYFMGLCLMKMGKQAEAEEHFNKLQPDDPNYDASRRALKMYGAR